VIELQRGEGVYPIQFAWQLPQKGAKRVGVEGKEKPELEPGRA
jgi:hypothetical protein